MKSCYLFGVASNVYIFYHSLMYVSINGELHIFKKLLKDVFFKYGDRYENLNILFTNEGQYHSKESRKDDFLKLQSSWTLSCLDEINKKIKIKILHFLNY